MCPAQTPLEQARFIFNTSRLIRDRISRIVSARQAHGGRLARFGEISVSQLHALFFIRERGHMTIKDLAETLSVSAPSASSMVDRLVDKGLVMREPDPQDRRRVFVRISPEATRDMEVLEETVLQAFVDLVEELGPETSRDWCRILERVHSVLNDETKRLERLP
ncbi:DNA-binding transcriptional regulator, MarR family [Desulfacinum hydrothermale DSM 13146]|uniref:DNA-binding transcriptional regulator, MarR family n=1 Tax=Desulfacinum hydrothermale DSM 13146 TaxID=1121390 RepID=A0A1W1XM01_9BACT|nr:MarR family transcriptional regulator [Desulfacinum hydrothermale]SMC25020.1 DNA-binding transcriptional regulator, MarR family [Desulfacinum hydrothermale DSM 13146]